MGLFKLFDKLLSTDKKKENYGLMPWEQDGVDSHDYEPFNFEEEDLEDDDFCIEDDDEKE